MRRSCTIYGPGNFVHSVGVALEQAGFDVAPVVRDGDKPPGAHQVFVFSRMATIVVLERDGIIDSYTESVGTSRSKGTTTSKPFLAKPTRQDKHKTKKPPAAATDDDIPF